MEQIITQEIIMLITFLIKIVLWSLIISAPLILLTLEMYGYEKYKKWKAKEDKEHERIIVKRNKTQEDFENDIKEKEKYLSELDEKTRRRELDLELADIKYNALKELGLTKELPEEVVDDANESNEGTEEPIDKTSNVKKWLESMSVKELQEIAREHKLKWYSKMKKEELILKLEPLL